MHVLGKHACSRINVILVSGTPAAGARTNCALVIAVKTCRKGTKKSTGLSQAEDAGAAAFAAINIGY